jgi:mannose/fructose/N-acetylgalactosamine-specific phosphotransferase system component IIC
MAMTSGWCRVGLFCVAMVALLLSHRLVVVDAFFTGLSGTSRLPKVSSLVPFIYIHGLSVVSAMLNRLVGRFPVDN